MFKSNSPHGSFLTSLTFLNPIHDMQPNNVFFFNGEKDKIVVSLLQTAGMFEWTINIDYGTNSTDLTLYNTIQMSTLR